MNEFVLWGLGVIVGYIAGSIAMIIINYYITHKKEIKNENTK